MPIPAGYVQQQSGYWSRLSDQAGPFMFDGTSVALVPNSGTLAPATALTTASSGNVANASAIATLAGVAGKTTYITGFEITSAGATTAAVVSATLAGLAGGTATYTYAVPAGATIAGPMLAVSFNPALPASALNTAIVLTLPALGLGNTNATVSAHGYTV